MKLKLLIGTIVLLVVLLAGLKYLQPDVSEPTKPPPASSTARTFNPRVPSRHAATVPEADPQATEDSSFQALLERVFGTNGIPNVKPEQLEGYLKDNHRSAASLLAASRVTGDRAFLREAMEKYPNDPHVAFEAYFRAEPYDNSKPNSAERRKWLETLRQADPNNALGDYLSARDHFTSGQAELALQELATASRKRNFSDYAFDFLQSSEEAYRAAGSSEVAAKWAAGTQLLLPTLTELKQVGLSLVDSAKQYRQSGDNASAQAILDLGMNLRERFNGPDQFPLINTLVGMAVERMMLNAMDPTSVYGASGQTVQSRIDALNQQKAALKAITGQATSLLPNLTDQDLLNYRERLQTFGEAAAMRWVVDKYGQQ